MPVLLPALLKMMWDVHSDQGPTPEPVKAALLQGATDCLILLDCCSEGRVKVSWGPHRDRSLPPQKGQQGACKSLLSPAVFGKHLSIST